MCTVALRHKDIIAKFKVFVVPGDDSVLLGMLDIKLLGILKIMCEGMGDKQADRKFDSQIIQQPNNPSCKINNTQQIRADSVSVETANSNMPNYFKFGNNTIADKKAS